MSAKPESGTVGPLVERREARRLCIALIAAHQDQLRRTNGIDPEALIGARLLAADGDAIDEILIGESTLGFDSLSILALVTDVARFFGLPETGIEDYLVVRRRLGDWADLVSHHFRIMGDRASLTFTTSGSTGPGQQVTHAAAALESEVAAIRTSILAGQPASINRVVSMVTPQHVYGFLWSCLLPARLGVDVVDLHGASPTRLAREARTGDLVLGTPFTWQRIETVGKRLEQGVTGVTSGAPSTSGTWSAAQSIGLSRLVDIYGSTETGGIGWREAETAGFRLMTDLTRKSEQVSRCGAALEIQDRLIWANSENFDVVGRNDSVIQVAGTNVNPEIVRRTLLSDPRVRDASVRLEGDRLKAFIVPATGEDSARIESCLRVLTTRDLPAPARPTRFTFGEALPRSPGGKLADW